MSNAPSPALQGRMIHISNPVAPIIGPQPHEPPTTAFEPFGFPPFPLSQSAWLVGLAEYFYQHKERCIVALLVLETQQQHWVAPMIPAQRCAADGASFRLIPGEFQAMPASHRIAGSFQISFSSHVDEARALIPAFDGLHFVHSMNRYRKKYVFLNFQGYVREVTPESIMVDDWRLFLLDRRSRLTIE